jgi:hypothetical protein
MWPGTQNLIEDTEQKLEEYNVDNMAYQQYMITHR